MRTPVEKIGRVSPLARDRSSQIESVTCKEYGNKDFALAYH